LDILATRDHLKKVLQKVVGRKKLSESLGNDRPVLKKKLLS
jgi:hypothetical protein